MVVVRGRSIQLAVVGLVFAAPGIYMGSACLSWAYRGPRDVVPVGLSPVFSYDWYVAVFWSLILPLLLISCYCCIAGLRMARSFWRGGGMLTLDQEGLHFPVFPDGACGRSFAWADVERVSVVTRDSCPAAAQGLVSFNNFFSGSPLLLLFDLKAQSRETYTVGWLGLFWRLIYWFDQLVTRGAFPGNAVLESISTGKLSHGQVFAAIESFCDDLALREQFGRTDATYVIDPSSDQLRFILE